MSVGPLFRSALLSKDLRKWKKSRRPLLLPEHAAARLVRARRYQNWTATEWQHVRWSDESVIRRGVGERQEYVFRRPGEALER